jgi:serine/threonine protein kinase
MDHESAHASWPAMAEASANWLSRDCGHDTPPDVTATSYKYDAEADVPLDWKVGDLILDLYEVTKVHRGGGMGHVYRVHHSDWNVDLAVKCPRLEYIRDEAAVQMFVQEAESWVNLGLHPHIVTCYYVRVLGAAPRAVPRVFAEYVGGGSLHDWIIDRRLYDGKPELALGRILDKAIQAAWGLHFAHTKHLVHNDIKPANLLLTPDGILKVTDFGLAQARAAIGASPATTRADQSVAVPGRGLMTPAYCSPEQADGASLSAKSDLWSWALTVLEMFNGARTWVRGNHANQILQDYLRNYQAPSHDSMVPAMPEDLVELLQHCFKKDPAERPNSLLDVAVAVKAIYERKVEVPYPLDVPDPADEVAGTLNNWALSLLDLRKAEQASRYWSRAVQADPQHLETTYNLGVVLWRQGTMPDDMVVRKLEAVRSSSGGHWRATFLLSLVHLERGDLEAALPLLEEAAQQAPDETRIQDLAARARSGSQGVGGICRGPWMAHLPVQSGSSPTKTVWS